MSIGSISGKEFVSRDADARLMNNIGNSTPYNAYTLSAQKPNPHVSSRRHRPHRCKAIPVLQRRSRPSTTTHCQIPEPHYASRPNPDARSQTPLDLDIEQLVIPMVRLGERSAIEVDPELFDGGVRGSLLVEIEIPREDEVVVDLAVDDLGILEGSLAVGEVDDLAEEVDVAADFFFPVEFPTFELLSGGGHGQCVYVYVCASTIEEVGSLGEGQMEETYRDD